MQRTVTTLRKTIQGINVPVTVTALLLALAMWYINKLEHTYATTVELPIRIENSADNTIGVLESDYRIGCRIEGAGYELLAYTLLPRRRALSIDLSRVEVLPTGEEGLSEIALPSLAAAVAEQLGGGIRLVSILTPRLEVVAAPLHTKKLPIRSRIDLQLRNPYMQIGPVRLFPDSIEVKTLGVVLDTLRAVYTEARSFDDVAASLSGRIGLRQPPDVMLPVTEVGYQVTVEEFTEVDLTLPLTLRNGPSGRTALILPDRVAVRLDVSRSRYDNVAQGRLTAWIDYDERMTNIGQQYKVHLSTEGGIEVKEVAPLYVELVFEQEP